jgi:hypothetical protein
MCPWSLLMDDRSKYYFEIKRNDVTIKQGTMPWEEAWRFAQDNHPCSVQHFRPKKVSDERSNTRTSKSITENVSISLNKKL